MQEMFTSVSLAGREQVVVGLSGDESVETTRSHGDKDQAWYVFFLGWKLKRY